MNRILVNTELKSKLQTLSQQVELCDESGKTLGHFFPEAVYRRLLYTWANSQVTDEELEARLNEPGGERLADFWARIDAQ